ncbi:matrix remodeling-associated protein 8 [Haplochromis burtoni]|uniref:matrix remodeling-associated protein 8 n=1 Tax=Haplochromis burtoni TaxID=8153 RepID=UPI0003BD62EF|nr:matrix remodeling-associated protein 8 [Haplochromis burtoni]
MSVYLNTDILLSDVGMEMVSTQGLKFVMLPFKIPHDLPQGTTVEWRHNNVEVYKYTDVNVDSQHVDDRGRTEMKEDALRTGDLSLTLKDLHLTDSGVYTCTVYNKGGHMLLQKSVTLRVRESQPEVVEVKQGLRSVQLPFETTSVLSQDVTVEWRLTEPKYMVVHMYTCGNDQPDKHNQIYRGRTEMNKEPLENGDLSLTLKDLRLTDSGFYTCTVYNKDGHMLTQKSVTLRVRATLVGAMADMLPRPRRRRAPEELGNRNQEQQPLIAESRV